eukprot:CAMPEP_0118957854 /NCGR_PEP_ID=MMETSP1169-20130426/62322_1 /TAXON_ID=36882 /ORGANISM="Pyramimonas obovata, Strain CCMP722" /LENGTH=907 /DNA_ID=CAMNT_0006905957 /DNA_START=1083 /DNA_END=3806 /DNA_ORIENTATION=+
MTLTLEVLGELSWLEDRFTTTAMGDISMYQMLYQTMTTVSTVGYGDFAPKTMLSRLWILVVIPTGVVFFTVLTGDLIQLKQKVVSGRGEYLTKKRVSFMVVCGGAVTSDSSLTVSNLLREILHPDGGEDNPDVVLVGNRDPRTWVGDLMRERQYRDKLKYIRGHPADWGDTARAKLPRAELVMVVGDIFADLPDREDQKSAMLAAVVLNKMPYLNLRLVLLRPESRALAINLGVPRGYCYAINEIKAQNLAQMCICPGLNILVLNLLTRGVIGADPPPDPTQVDLEGRALTANEEYMLGARRCLYGCQLSNRFVGMPFRELFMLFFSEHNVYLVALQDSSGMMHAFPMDRPYTGQPIYVAAMCASHVDAIASRDAPRFEWKKAYSMNVGRSEGAGANLSQQLGGCDSDDHEDKEMEEMLESLSSSMSEPSRQVPTEAAGKRPLGKMQIAGRLAAVVDEQSFCNKPKSDEKMQSAQDACRLSKLISGRGYNQKDTTKEVRHGITSDNCSDPELLVQILATGEHIVIILQDGTLWQQLVAVIRGLHSSHLPVQYRVLVVSQLQHKAPPVLVEKYKDTNLVFLYSALNKKATLAMAGVADAYMVMIISGRPTTKNPAVDMDRDLFITASLVEGCQAEVMFPIPLLMDLHFLGNVTQLKGTVPRSWSRYHHRLLKKKLTKAWKRGTAVNAITRSSSSSHESRRKNDSSRMMDDTGDPTDIYKNHTPWIAKKRHQDISEEDAVYMHPRFTGGYLMCRADLLRGVGYAFATPGCLAVMEAIMDPELTNQRYHCTLLLVPFMFFNCPVAGVLRQLAKDDIALLGVARAFSPANDNVCTYTVGFPHAGMVLQEDDKLFVCVKATELKSIAVKYLKVSMYHRALARRVANRWKKLRKQHSKLKQVSRIFSNAAGCG